MQTHKIPSVGTLTHAMRKNQVMLDVDKYIKKLMCISIGDDLQINTKNIQRYIGGPATLHTMLCMLQDQMERGFRTIYPESMEERVHFNKDAIKQ